jgi:hypothetical protein
LPGCRLFAIRHVELRQDLRNVMLDGLKAKTQPLCDLRIRELLPDKREYFLLASVQVRRIPALSLTSHPEREPSRPTLD